MGEGLVAWAREGQDGMVSGRPEAICVAVLDADEERTDRLAADLGAALGARVTAARSAGELKFNGTAPCHVLVIDRASDPDLELLAQIRSRYTERELPIIVTDDDENGDEEHLVQATRAGANAVVDRSIHRDSNFLGKLVYSLAYE